MCKVIVSEMKTVSRVSRLNNFLGAYKEGNQFLRWSMGNGSPSKIPGTFTSPN